MQNIIFLSCDRVPCPNSLSKTSRRVFLIRLEIPLTLIIYTAETCPENKDTVWLRDVNSCQSVLAWRVAVQKDFPNCSYSPFTLFSHLNGSYYIKSAAEKRTYKLIETKKIHTQSRNSSVGIAARLLARRSGVLIPAESWNVSFLHNVRTGSGAQRAFYSVGTNFFPLLKRQGAWS